MKENASNIGPPVTMCPELDLFLAGFLAWVLLLQQPAHVYVRLLFWLIRPFPRMCLALIVTTAARCHVDQAFCVNPADISGDHRRLVHANA